tara:strand:- start:802 stop:1473 length:672 start_codon:yes stop_codon:yes gene_type:complete
MPPELASTQKIPQAKPAADQPIQGAPGTQDVDALVKKSFSDVLSGKSKRFDDKTLAQMKQGLFESTRGQSKQAKRSLRSELARSGTFRSGAMGRGVTDINRAAMASFTSGVKDIMLEKAKVEWQDRQKALDQAQTWLGQKQQYDMGLKQIAATIESARIRAGATLGAAKLGADASIKSSRAMAGASRYSSLMQYNMGQDRLHEAQRQHDIAAIAAGIDINPGR